MQAELLASIKVERIGKNDMSLRALAILRMTVFRGWPYLYDGSLDYETGYLAEFLSDDAAVLVAARVGDIPVGMATASPMATQPDAITAPFLAAGVDTGSLFYFGESVLLAQFRGLGVGHRFFDVREAAARAAGADSATFCAIVREPGHPSEPENNRDLTPFWERRGYCVAPGFATTMRWKEVGQREESDHPMRFWIKRL